MAAYKAQMAVQTGCEASWCKFFPTTLKGMALNRFIELPWGVVTTFAVLEALNQHFVAAKKHKKTSIQLMACKQGEHESLGDYIKRFNTESLEIGNLQDSVALAALMSGLRRSRLRFDLLNDEVSTFAGATKKYINAADINHPLEAQASKRDGKKEKS